MPEKTQPEPKDATMLPEVPQPNPALMRQQQLQQQYQQINGRLMELRQKESLIKDLITNTTIEAAEIRGAMKELDNQLNYSNEIKQKG